MATRYLQTGFPSFSSENLSEARQRDADTELACKSRTCQLNSQKYSRLVLVSDLFL